MASLKIYPEPGSSVTGEIGLDINYGGSMNATTKAVSGGGWAFDYILVNPVKGLNLPMSALLTINNDSTNVYLVASVPAANSFRYGPRTLKAIKIEA